MAEDDDDALRLESDHEASGRTAIVSDEGDSVWLYLTAPDGAELSRDCWLFNKPSAPAEPKVDQYGEQSLPPPAPASLIRPEGVGACPPEEAFDIVWSADGESVLVRLRGAALGMICAGYERGFSCHLQAECGWGQPFDDELMQRTF